jgi:hypothetical protein
MTRRYGLILGIACLVAFAPNAQAEDEDQLDQALTSGLAYLARQQNPDGSFGSDASRAWDTGASLLAFLSTGNTFEGGRYAGNVRRATEFLVRQLPADRASGSAGQAIATLALCEASGVEPDEPIRLKIREVAQNALPILATSKDDDGWRSAAYRSAERIGLRVPAAPTTPVPTTAAPTTGPSTVKASDDPFELAPAQLQNLLSSQLPDGSWPAAEKNPNLRIRATALAILQLGRKWSLMPAQQH